MEHRFDRGGYTVGVEEELMLLDGESLDLTNAIEAMLEDAPEGLVRPELMESVLEIATDPQPDVPGAAAQLQAMRGQVRGLAERRGLQIGSSGTHPFARWEDQRIVARERYQGLVDMLGFVARQELIFGMHVHVGIGDPDEAIHVVNGLRPYVPVLVALSANSPFWRGEDTGLVSSRVPIFRAFPRVGIPPRFASWADFERRVEFMVSSGVIEEYTYLWYDVRPHPRFGTVEIRAMDSQTDLRHTVALTALVQCLVRELSQEFLDGIEAADPPFEIIDENKWVAARHGVHAELVDAAGARVAVPEILDTMLTRLASHASELGCTSELEGLQDLLEHGGGGDRQRSVYEHAGDLRAVVDDVVRRTA